MKEFDDLLEVAAILNGPNGCPWDLKQTFKSLQTYVLEESHELLEAIDLDENEKIIEELGDLLYTIVFYAKLAQKQNRFQMRNILETVKEKLIRRHPHIFAEEKLETSEEVATRWEKIKKEEKAHSQRESLLDGIPTSLPALIRAQKVIKKILRSPSDLFTEKQKCSLDVEEAFGEEILQAILRAEEANVDAESALRRVLSRYEMRFREWEKKQNLRESL